LPGWTSVKRSSLKDVAIAAIALSAFVTFFYLRRGDICLTQSIVLAVMFPFVAFIFEWRLHQMVWHDVWRKAEKPSDPIDQVIEGVLGEAGIPSPSNASGPGRASGRSSTGSNRDISSRTGRGSPSVERTRRRSTWGRSRWRTRWRG